MGDRPQAPDAVTSPARQADPDAIADAVAVLTAEGDKGDDGEQAFRVLYETYFPVVRAFFAKRVKANDLALDLTQETFIRVYKGIEGYRSDGPFGAWLFRIAWNVLRSRQNIKSIRELEEKSVSLDDSEPQHARREVQIAASRSDEEDRAFVSVLRTERLAILRRGIAALPGQRRKCMILWAYHQLSYEQIATVMRLSVGTVKAHLNQARRQLARKIASSEDRNPREIDE